jgi:Tfp pilus assembly protein PilW
LVETIFYVVILSFALLAVTQTLLIVTRSYSTLKNAERLEEEATFSLERMIREIRDARSVDDAGSLLGAHPGRLLLASTDISGNSRTVEFSLEGGKLTLKEDGVTTGLLSSAQTNISNLVFRKIATARSQGVTIEMTMRSGTSTAARTENFYATAALRDSY